jgi:hypothetical protein
MKWLLLLGFLSGCENNAQMMMAPPKLMLPAGCDEDKLTGCLAKQQVCSEGGSCQACPLGQYAAMTGVCKPIGDPIVHDFPEITSASGSESYGRCRSWTLNNPTELWVNAVELEQDEASHHSNWLYVPDNEFAGPDGIWRCRDRNYDPLKAALVGGVLYAQSTQATHEVQKFPNSAAIRLPPYARIISDIHILNATGQAVTGHVRLSLYTLPLDQVKVKLAPFHLGFTALEIPPMGTSRNHARCDLDPSFQSAFNHGVDAKVYYILPHYHALGNHFFVSRIAGPKDGEMIFESGGTVGEAYGRAFDPPIDLSGIEGLGFGCDFDNPTGSTVGWGFGDQEMCEMLGFSDSPLSWTGQVGTVGPDPAGGSLPTYTGTCGTVAFEYDFNSPGGTGH